MRIALPPVIAADQFAERDASLPIVALDGTTMGTTWRVLLVRPRHVDPATLRSAIVARLDRFVGELSHWDPTSTLSQFNRARAGHWAVLPADFAHVIATGLAIAETTDGAFDPAIGHLVDLSGFGPAGPVPGPGVHVIEEARKVSGWRRLAFDPTLRRLRQPGGLALDLSGIAKGYAVDVIANLLDDAGVGNSLVEIGGELVGRGIRPDGEPWWVDLEVPPGTAITPLRLALNGPAKGLAVATSGRYRRGEHTLDPRTGHRSRNGVLSASVIHTTAIEADTWATALTVLGPVDGMACAARHHIAARMIVDIAGMTREYLSPALDAMLFD